MKNISIFFNNIQRFYFISVCTDEQNNVSEDEISKPELSNQASTSSNKSKYVCLFSDF